MTADGWSRLSPWAMVFLFLRGLVRFLRENIPLLAGAGAGIAFVEAIGLREVVLGAAFLLTAGALLCLLYYRRFRYRVEDAVLLVQKGLVEHSELKVHADQIQQVMIEEPWNLRLFGLVRFSVDTPGGSATEVELPGITREAAEDLRRALDGAEEHAGMTEPEAGPAPLFRATTPALLLHGLASNYAWFALAAMAPFLNRIERLIRERWDDIELPAFLAELLERPLLGGASLLLILLVCLIGASVVISVLRFYGFELYRSTGNAHREVRFSQRSGLLSRKEQVLSARRLQVVEQVQSAIGRLLGRQHLVCRQIGSVQSEQDVSGQMFLVPALDAPTAASLLPEFWPGVATSATFQPVSRHYRRVIWLRLSLLTALILGWIAFEQADVRLLLGIVPVLGVLWPIAHLRWRAVAWHEQDDYLQVRRGVLGRRISIFPRVSVQRAGLQQSWFQRRRGVATLHLTLASGPITIPYLPAAVAWRLLADVLESVESPAGARRDNLSGGDCRYERVPFVAGH